MTVWLDPEAKTTGKLEEEGYVGDTNKGSLNSFTLLVLVCRLHRLFPDEGGRHLEGEAGEG